MDLEQQNARKIIDALKSGTPPPENIEKLTVGRLQEQKILSEKMNLAQEGRPQTLFIRGEYGEGKSHLLTLLQNNALKANFIVATVTLDSREQPLHKLERIYYYVAKTLNVLENGRVNNITLGEIFSRCASEMLKAVEPMLYDRCKHGLHYAACANFCLGQSLLSNHFPVIAKQKQGLSAALKLLVWSKSRKDEDLEFFIQTWINGEHLTRAEFSYIRKFLSKSDSTLPKSIPSNDIINVLLSLSNLVDLLKFNGISIVFDEAEAIPSINIGKNRMAAYFNLCQIISAPISLKKGKIMFIYATTPTFYYDVGIFFDSLRNIGTEKYVEVVETLLKKNTIELSPISSDEKLELMRLISATSYEAKGKRMPEDFWEKLGPVAKMIAELNWPIRAYVTYWCNITDIYKS
ncbi:MAG: ATP-binding protein [Bacteroidetes bacterium]|nr:ATP-binding protein [Bacteroidota bacterium]